MYHVPSIYKCTSKFRKRCRLAKLNLKVLIDLQSSSLPISTKFPGLAINHLIIPEPFQGYHQIWKCIYSENCNDFIKLELIGIETDQCQCTEIKTGIDIKKNWLYSLVKNLIEFFQLLNEIKHKWDPYLYYYFNYFYLNC